MVRNVYDMKSPWYEKSVISLDTSYRMPMFILTLVPCTIKLEAELYQVLLSLLHYITHF